MGAVSLQPGIINAAEAFAEAGYAVDLFFVRNRFYPLPVFASPDIRLRASPITFARMREPRWLATLAFALWLPYAARGQYTAVVAGGVRGLLAAWILAFFRPCRIINLQLELYIGAKLNTRAARLFKWIERRAIRSAWLSLIHDERRAEMLMEDAKIPRDAIEILPNSPRGSGQVRSSRFLHDRFALPHEMRLIVAPGSIGPAFGSEQTVTVAQQLPDRWRCIVHSAQSRTMEDPYMQLLQSRNTSGRVLFSLDPVPHREVDSIITSATIGLAIYGEVGGPNTTEVGLASGKLCHFLQMGIPVIVSDYPMLREFVLKHRVGLPLSDGSDLSELVAEIEKDYAGYRSRAAACFTRELSFDTHFTRVLERLAKEIGGC
jgi:glycosyltransferase involved in cell wall biosynthesis